MSALSTAEFERLSLIAAGVDSSQIPSILDTATWRRLLIAGLLKNAANQAISGQVANYSQLPVTVGAPAIGATYLVLNPSGIYYINYKSAGIYVKVTDTGSLSDWVYAPLSALGTLPDVTLTSPQVGDTLSWNGTRWINKKYQIDVFNTAGTFTWNIPVNAQSLQIEIVGGGAGGSAGNTTGTGSGGQGGGGGGYTNINVRKNFAATSATIVVGAGGFGGTFGSGAVSTPGGISSVQFLNFGTISALGGSTGLVFGAQGGMFAGNNGGSSGVIGSSSFAGGGGGGGGGTSNTGGVTNPPGAGGRSSFISLPNPQTNFYYPGQGGSGGTAAGGPFPANGQSGMSGLGYGGGGGGGGGSAPLTGPANAGNGGNGRGGFVLITTYF